MIDLRDPAHVAALAASLSADAPTLAAMRARADAIAAITPLDAHDLRGWHFVTTGGLLLHVAAHGRDDGMNGRHGFVHDSYAACHAGLRRVAAVLAAWAHPIPRIFAPADRASAALALAAATLFHLPATPWPDDGTPDPGLIIVHDLDTLSPAQRASLATHRPHQLLYAHAATWTDARPFGADLIGRLHQFSRAPWDGFVGLDPSTGLTRDIAPDPSPIATLAARIVAATDAAHDPIAHDDPADLAALLALATATRSLTGDAIPAALRDHGPRHRAWSGSPVASLRFP